MIESEAQFQAIWYDDRRLPPCIRPSRRSRSRASKVQLSAPPWTVRFSICRLYGAEHRQLLRCDLRVGCRRDAGGSPRHDQGLPHLVTALGKAGFQATVPAAYGGT